MFLSPLVFFLIDNVVRKLLDFFGLLFVFVFLTVAVVKLTAQLCTSSYYLMGHHVCHHREERESPVFTCNPKEDLKCAKERLEMMLIVSDYDLQ